MEHKYFIFNKPYGTLCQFTGEENDSLLGDFYNYPKDVYSVGRLDKDSEGLLLLTNDNRLKDKVLNPEKRKSKKYLVQVDGDIDQKALTELSNGSIVIKHKGKAYKVTQAIAQKVATPNVEERNPPIRERKNIPTSWITLELTEGKNRQVRKMTAAVGFPTLRLFRLAVGAINLEGLSIGEVKELTRSEAYKALE
mgnify:CR=1 FL=1